MTNCLSPHDRADIQFRVLNAVANHPEASQRQLARTLGVSLGRINYCVKALAASGSVKIERFRNSSNKQGYAVVITPSGLAQRARSASQFLARKQAEYEALRQEIEDLSAQVLSIEALQL